MNTFKSAMVNNYDWSALPFKPTDQWLKKMLIKFEDCARTDGRGNYWIDGKDTVNAESPDKLFHKFVLNIVFTAQTKIQRASRPASELFEELKAKNLEL